MYRSTHRPESSAGAKTTPQPMLYQAWKGSNIFIFGGRLILGPQVRSLFYTVVLIVTPIPFFCVFVARKLLNHFSHHVGMLVMIVPIVFTLYDLFLLLLTSARDPGIIPRNTRPPEPEGSNDNTARFPRIKDVIVNGMNVRTKYCDTCMLYRPPRCSHCSICNNCVQRFDHHCPWVGQCIGLRNYRYFYMFVFSTTLLGVYIFAFCCICIKKIMKAEDCTIWKAMSRTPASVILMIYILIVVWFVFGLSIFHFYLISFNQTTYENFKLSGRPNPYDRGIVKNFIDVFFTSIPPAINFRSRLRVEDLMDMETREIETGRKAVDARDDFLGYMGPFRN